VSALAIPDEVDEPFCTPYIYRGLLTLVSGYPGAGKGSFEAFLATMAARTLFLLGPEERFTPRVKARLCRAGVDLSTVEAIQNQDCGLPNARDDLLEVMQQGRFDLLVVDPLMSFMEESRSENDGVYVRSFLEALAYIAGVTKAAVVAVHHPGKADGNLLPGSRSFLAVPRGVIELHYHEGPPERRTLRVRKPPQGDYIPDRRFLLDIPQGQAPLFVLGDEVDPRQAVLEREVPDRMERKKVDRVEEKIRLLLAKGRMPSKLLYRTVKEELGVSDSTVWRALDRMDIGYDPGGPRKAFRVFLKPPPAVPPDDQ
jgi:hypothetical protein